jgi:hypothetical protein
MHRRLAVSLAIALALASPAAAAAAINITSVRYNPPGPDTGSNASLVAEYVTIHNNGRSAKALTGWRLHDNQHHRFTFPAFSLCGHCSVRIRTGSGTNGAANLYWGLGNYVWNNTADKATLVKPTGVIRDTCAYTGATAGQKIC